MAEPQRLRLIDLNTPWFWLLVFFRRQYGEPWLEATLSHGMRIGFSWRRSWWLYGPRWEPEPAAPVSAMALDEAKSAFRACREGNLELQGDVGRALGELAARRAEVELIAGLLEQRHGCQKAAMPGRPAAFGSRGGAMTTETVTLNDHEELNPSTSHHVEWEALPTKQHLPSDDLEASGTGPDGWGIYLAEMHGDGYFAWLPNEAAAKHIVDEHNVLVRALNGDEEER